MGGFLRFSCDCRCMEFNRCLGGNVFGIEEYEDALYQTFYRGGPGAEKHLPNLPPALKLFNGFFQQLYAECLGQPNETLLIKRFTRFIYGLTGKPHFIFVRHHMGKSMFHCEGELWDNSKSMEKAGKPFLWQEYEIDIADAKHERQFDIETTLAHELVHIIEENLCLQK